MKPIRLTVIVPTCRRPDTVGRAVRSALDEPIDDLEVIVVDDDPARSARNVIEAIDDPRVRYEVMPEPSGGVPALVRNYAMSLAVGEILYFLDDDDLVIAGGLDALLVALEARPDVAVAIGQVKCAGPDELVRQRFEAWFDHAARTARRLRWSSRLTVAVSMFRGTLIINSCCAVRRRHAQVLGGYDPEIEVYEDVDFYLRAIRAHGHVVVSRPVLLYTTGRPSIMHDLAVHRGDRAAVERSYARIHEGYRTAHGRLEYTLLQVLAKVLRIGPTRRHRHDDASTVSS